MLQPADSPVIEPHDCACSPPHGGAAPMRIQTARNSQLPCEGAARQTRSRRGTRLFPGDAPCHFLFLFNIAIPLRSGEERGHSRNARSPSRNRIIVTYHHNLTFSFVKDNNIHVSIPHSRAMPPFAISRRRHEYAESPQREKKWRFEKAKPWKKPAAAPPRLSIRLAGKPITGMLPGRHDNFFRRYNFFLKKGLKRINFYRIYYRFIMACLFQGCFRMIFVMARHMC